MYLYNLTLQKSTAIFQSVSGNFSGSKAVEIIVSNGHALELLRPDDSGRLDHVLYSEAFGVIRSIAPFRLTGGSKDYLIVGSDSGRVVILEYNPSKNVFEKVHQETFGRSGCRRIVPGQYISTDPKGRAFMIGAIEKQKLVYILNRDSQAKLSISSPLEAHKAHTIVFSMCGVDVGFENPIFATISVDYSEETNIEDVEETHNTKVLTFYELDLGLNNVVRKWSEEVDRSANLVVSVPGGSDGPGGVLVCAQGRVYYRNIGHADISVSIPRRNGMTEEKSLMIVSHASHKQRDMFFFLVQSEYGDLYKITLDYSGEMVSGMQIAYFDTFPTANCITMLKNGFLFVASEFGDHGLYLFKSLGLDDAPTASSAGNTEMVFFEPVFEPRNLVLTATISSLSPIVDFKVADLAQEGTPQMYALSGVSERANLRVLRHGLPITQMVDSQLPGTPAGIWTIPQSLTTMRNPQYQGIGTVESPADRYIVVSFVGSTLVLGVGETVEEVQDSGILSTTTTILIRSMGANLDSIVQIFAQGIRHINAERRVSEWRAPGRKTISIAAANQQQVIICIGGSEIIYFELDPAGNLTEVFKKDMRKDINCIEFAPIPRGRTMSRFVAISDYDGPVRILSLERDNMLNQVSMVDTDRQQVEQLCVAELMVHEPGVDQQIVNTQRQGTLFLHIGLKNGVLKRAVLDGLTGEISDMRTRILGRRPIKFFRVKIKGSPAVLALSTRVWMCYSNLGRYEITPLSVEPLDHAASLSSDQCPEGIVATSENNLKIFSIEKLGDLFNQVQIPLSCTPKRFVVHPQTNYIVSIETEHNFSTQFEPELAQDLEMPRAGKGKWKSVIRILDPVSNQTLDLVSLTNNEAAFSIGTVMFQEGEVMLAVGCAKDVQLQPRGFSSASIHLYQFVENGQKLALVHTTETDLIPHAVGSFQGKLIAGVGNVLRLYELGKKKLLRKCENRKVPNQITSIQSQGDRIVVSDVQESVHFFTYRRSENVLVLFADDTAPRFVTSCVMLDFDTVAIADKFGTIAVVRMPPSSDTDIDIENELDIGTLTTKSKLALNGAANKLELVASFYVGETCCNLTRTSLMVGGSEVIIYTTLGGAIGALIPFSSREEVDFFAQLEMQMRQEKESLCGRDHLSYRSYYFPVKNVIDGDLCEQYSTLDATKQRSVAEELIRNPSEVLKKLEDIRSQKLL
ncbi:CPSF domain-containing protein [Cavenderia fasciculata]|uniref:CPSF domain-containing protein n=1 Tax=Cavenderia fasciculata TaxID=261658 RepID=F4Q3I9_CACFS|nr:CPSF domain-containing protein [Cavenderia fasciculata]EGG17647.1 CPSF domain-containing protein [Cavenderia fasciculata]|eukprot:XP_004356131.1 CPSF domain-containing protein [Cavenderia fasciculata]